jgi:hypothetical protein
MTVLLFIHFLGSALWIGGAMAAMVVALNARTEDGFVRAGAFRLLAPVHTLVIGPGALLALASGILLTMQLMTAGSSELMAAPRIWVMQGTGLIGGLLVLFVGLPTAVRVSGLAMPDEKGSLPQAFERYRKRQAVVSSVAGALAVISLFAGVVL